MSEKQKIVVNNLFKIFGPTPEKALKLIKQGLTKDEIFKKTGNNVGVQNASFSINEGEIFVIMGLSGSGKSTLVRMLNRLIEPTSGEVIIDGKDITKMKYNELISLRRTQMSMVFQSFALLPHLNVIDNVCFGLELAKVEKKNRYERGMAALEQVGLSQYAKSMPDELSGGMRQRVGLARALAVDPEILLMDEAFSALDPLIRSEMQDELLELQSKQKRTIVFISHDLDEAIKLGDRIAIMEGGRIVQIGTAEEILKNPADDYVKAFFKGVDPANILTAGDLLRKDTQVTVIRHPGDGPRVALQRLINYDRDFGYVLDKDRRFVGIVSADKLKEILNDDRELTIVDALIEKVEPVNINEPMQNLLELLAKSNVPIPVVDDDMRFKGVISRNSFIKSLYQNKSEMENVNV
ncbi:glycine betaine/L-proline ABC transporter ATP-binding protein ProV [Deferribacterales bacterium Es71-Z0220]|jgi:glycine betaine/proline transport system ATP-binding protein|uniref:glycine betaine/L-proline ABC transporter ATP-binding protein ProV n=1 Tax=Deferrivibrio essentukiensis TaxID=2880922 RepID=UPI001F612553|nr:glycine betaine/L-proline ABC transporter ATP-binding protein ProV [Deferrivibrio essentukiensis]MBZ4672389.1 glycine betaine/L-proline transporter ATP-binding protein [Deferribacteraceae bacterium]MCB4203865.1 glycine betaine/L-proline ABC transporter ATP-binding protein ProV [Deferrivibrio essentukiensis]